MCNSQTQISQTQISLLIKQQCLKQKNSSNVKLPHSFSCVDNNVIAHTVYVFRTKWCFSGPRLQCLLGSLGAKCGRPICFLTFVPILI